MRLGPGRRRSTGIARGLVGVFVLLLIATGFASAAVVGAAGIGAVDPSGQSSPILLVAGVLRDGSAGRVVLITLMACVIFLAVLTTVTSVTFTAAVSFAYDVFARGRRRRTETGEIRALRAGAVIVGTVGLSLAAAIHRYPTDFLVTFSISVAASCIFPALVYSFFWRRFNRRGLLWSVYGGLLFCTVLTAFSPVVSGTVFALWPEAHFDWYPFVSSPQDSALEFRGLQYRVLTGRELGSRAADLQR